MAQYKEKLRLCARTIGGCADGAGLAHALYTPKKPMDGTSTSHNKSCFFSSFSFS